MGHRHVTRVPGEVGVVEQLLDGGGVLRLIRPHGDAIGPDGIRIGAVERSPHTQYLRFKLEAVADDERVERLVGNWGDDPNRLELALLRSSNREGEKRVSGHRIGRREDEVLGRAERGVSGHEAALRGNPVVPTDREARQLPVRAHVLWPNVRDAMHCAAAG